MATWPPSAAKHKTVVLQAGLHTGSEGGAGFTSWGSQSTGSRASCTALSQTWLRSPCRPLLPLRLLSVAPNSYVLSELGASTGDRSCWGGRRHDQGHKRHV